MKFIGRFSGVVAYVDGTNGQFAAHIDERGNVSSNSGINNTPNDSAKNILEIQENNTWLQDMLALVTGTVNPITLSPDGSALKVPHSAAIHFSGRVARDDNTWEDFAAQYDIKAGGGFILNSSGSGNGDVSAYDELADATIISWLESIVGDGNVEI